MKRVYLAGPILSCSYKDCTDWREEAKRKFAEYEIEGISPMRAKLHLAKESVISDKYKDVLCCSKGITTRDRYDVMNCDVVLANLLGAKNVSIGTIGEFFWADAFRKPIIAVMEKQGNIHDHAMIGELTGFRVETLEEGLFVARAILK